MKNEQTSQNVNTSDENIHPWSQLGVNFLLVRITLSLTSVFQSGILKRVFGCWAEAHIPRRRCGTEWIYKCLLPGDPFRLAFVRSLRRCFWIVLPTLNPVRVKDLNRSPDLSVSTIYSPVRRQSARVTSQGRIIWMSSRIWVASYMCTIRWGEAIKTIERKERQSREDFQVELKD